MPYLYRRKINLIDMLIDRVFAKKVVITDGATESGDYVIVLNGFEFRETDPTAGADESSTLATNLAAAINGSTVPITATATGNTITLVPDRMGQDFSIAVKTDDDEGTISYKKAEPESYQVKNAANWDGTFTVMETVPAKGKASKTAGPDPTPNGMSLNKWTRFRFAPTDYALEDDDLLFFRFAPVFDGVPGADSRITMVLTPEQLYENHTALILRGFAPVAADSDSATEFVFPAETTSIVVKNIDPAETVWLSFGTGAAEIPLQPGETFRDNKFGSGDIRIRTDVAGGADADVYIYATVNTSRIL